MATCSAHDAGELIEDIHASPSSEMTDSSGLSAEQVAKQGVRFGRNEIAKGSLRPFGAILLTQVSSPLVIVLWAAAGLSVVLSDWADAIAIVAIVILNASLGSWQESRAERAIESLRELAAPNARVIRDGWVQTILARDLVPGDLVVLQAGDRIPADLRLQESHALEIDESILTGESLPVVKSKGARAFSGSTVIVGRGEGIVEFIGASTEFGRIAKAIGSTSQPQTPLQIRMTAFGRSLSYLAMGLVAVVILQGLVSGEDFAKVVLTALSMAVAVVPEGLPAMLTVALALGAQRMLRRNALVRRLDSIETLGSITTICTDKTGTLTENRLKVQFLWPPDKRSILTEGFALCNDARRISATEFEGDPTEIALVMAAEEHGIVPQELRMKMPRLLEIPFSSETKRMTTVHRADDHYIAFTKGSLDAVLDLCKSTPAREAVFSEHDRLAELGMRVLALAYGRFVEQPELHDIRNLEFVGLVGMADSLRPEAGPAIATAKAAGIRVVMITGDHALTATRIAHQLGMSERDSFMATDVQSDELARVVGDHDVYARVSPHQKLEITQALQMAGEVLAVTGDGVNDAPALKKADVGVAMGRGTEVAREAADVVLLDDNFATIVAAIEEGRAIYANLRKFIRYVMGGNVGEIIVMLAAPLLGMPLPLAPIQILWVNLVTDGLPGLALTLEPAGGDLMKRSPVPPQEPILARGLLADVLWIGAVVAVIPLTLGFLYWRSDNPAWTTMVFTSLTMCQLWGVIGMRSSRLPLRKTSLGANPALVVTIVVTALLQCSLLYVPFLRTVFGTLALSARDLTIAIFASALTLVFVELRKTWLTAKFRLIRKRRAA